MTRSDFLKLSAIVAASPKAVARAATKTEIRVVFPGTISEFTLESTQWTVRFLPDRHLFKAFEVCDGENESPNGSPLYVRSSVPPDGCRG